MGDALFALVFAAVVCFISWAVLDSDDPITINATEITNAQSLCGNNDGLKYIAVTEKTTSVICNNGATFEVKK